MTKTAILSAVAAILSAPAGAADLRCDAPGVASGVIADMVSKNPSAQKLSLAVTKVEILAVDESGPDPACTVSVETNHGYAIRYRFVMTAKGQASLDMVP